MSPNCEIKGKRTEAYGSLGIHVVNPLWFRQAQPALVLICQSHEIPVNQAYPQEVTPQMLVQ